MATFRSAIFGKAIIFLQVIMSRRYCSMVCYKFIDRGWPQNTNHQEQGSDKMPVEFFLMMTLAWNPFLLL